ncbi:MAG: hypothetical protein OFPI_39050 [Osedax symbiont Rs2]|nr:MAG: hypothetical protein OFPI_39050 [Osedax symbiont Rs2]
MLINNNDIHYRYWLLWFMVEYIFTLLVGADILVRPYRQSNSCAN